jgi:Concanavalin A-like lectin/glucanases superfamily
MPVMIKFPYIIFSLVLLPLSLLAEAKLDQGLSLYLPFTMDLKDHSGANLPIKIKGQVRIDSEGAVFDGGNDWLIAPHIPLDHRPFAIAFWMRDETAEQSVGLVEQLDKNKHLRHFHIVLRKERQPFFSFYAARFISPLSIPTNQEWVHLVFQYTGKEQQIWMNGRLICTRQTDPYQGTNGPTTIGKIPRWTNVPGKNFKGHLRDFRIYGRDLDPGEIELLASANNAGLTLASASASTSNSPRLSVQAQASREAMAHLLATNPSVPFLEIGTQQLTINGQPGEVYLLESSGDLDNWGPLAHLTNLTGTVTYPLTNAAAERSQFFRVKVEANGQ